MIIDFKVIYFQKKIREKKSWLAHADSIISRFPKAQVQEVQTHWQIPELAQADPEDWIQTKNQALVLGIKTDLNHAANGRSADFIAASHSNGCLSSCQYCYVARRKGGSNPLTLFMNFEEIADSIEAHQEKLGWKFQANQTDPKLWTYDIGCNSDLSLDAQICDHPGYMIRRFAQMAYAKATFATKTINHSYWLSMDPQGHTRIRYSIMPKRIARIVDVRTSPVSDRIQSVNSLVQGGYEVHFNFSPIIIYGGDEWKQDWIDTFQEIDQVLSPSSKAQLACEAFFLTHSQFTHELNLKWNPKGEEFLWTPENQVTKKTKPDILVYDYRLKNQQLNWFKDAVKKYLPYCPIRYSF